MPAIKKLSFDTNVVTYVIQTSSIPSQITIKGFKIVLSTLVLKEAENKLVEESYSRKKAHKRAKKLMKYKDHIKTPYALAMWQEKREHPTFSDKQIRQIVKDHQKK